MSTRPTEALASAGQSIWLDNITRDLLDEGTIARFIAELNVTGLTSNPSIFDKAVAGSSGYDDQIRSLADAGHGPEEIFFELAIDDLRRAADLFASVHEETGGDDGWVSLEVSPTLADDTEGTIAAAVSLHERADRPNLYIKIPGTPAGLGAIEEAIFQGVSVNVTLLFDTDQYLAAADAYLKGLERRQAAGLDLAVHSVASLFVSRWDVATASSLPPELANTAGIAVAAAAYASSVELAGSPRVAALLEAGAPWQKLLFASTGTKDKSLSDTLYVEALAAPNTVNTMPDSTLTAFADHGSLHGALDPSGVQAIEAIARLANAGLDFAALAQRLQDEGKAAFVSSWNELLSTIEAKAGSAR